jgi:DNA-directed RNA polymerase subunit K/omega
MSSAEQTIIRSEAASARNSAGSGANNKSDNKLNNDGGHLVGSTATDTTEYMPDYRSILDHYEENKKTNTTSPVMTVFEKALVLGKRATQIAYGAEPLFDVPARLTKVEEIAEEELRLGKNPFIIKRDLGNSKFEYWAVRDMITSLD